MSTLILLDLKYNLWRDFDEQEIIQCALTKQIWEFDYAEVNNGQQFSQINQRSKANDRNWWANVQLLPNVPSVQLAFAMEPPFIQKNCRKQERLSFFRLFEEDDLADGSWNHEDGSSVTGPGLDVGIMTEETSSTTMLVLKMWFNSDVSRRISAPCAFLCRFFFFNCHQE